MPIYGSKSEESGFQKLLVKFSILNGDIAFSKVEMTSNIILRSDNDAFLTFLKSFLNWLE